MTTHKVSMKMRFKDVLDGNPIALGPVQIRFDFSQRVNNGRFISRNNIIGTLCQTSCVKLFNFHGR